MLRGDRPNRAGEEAGRPIADPDGTEPGSDERRDVALLAVDGNAAVAKERAAGTVEVIEVPVSEVREEAGVDVGQEAGGVGGEVDQWVARGAMAHDGEGRETASGGEHRVHENAHAGEIEDERRVSKEGQLQRLTSVSLCDATQRPHSKQSHLIGDALEQVLSSILECDVA